SSRRRHTRSDRDWSSDVCSSDLFRAFEEEATLAPVGRPQGGFLLERAEVAGRGDGALVLGYGRVALTRPLLGAAQQQQPADCTQIGRASCRERGEMTAGGGGS